MKDFTKEINKIKNKKMTSKIEMKLYKENTKI